MSAELLRLETERKCKDIINLANDKPRIEDNQSSSSQYCSGTNNNNQWKEVNYKKRQKRQMIVGNNTEVIVKGVPKYATLHVYRVDLKTTTVEFKNLLTPYFPEVICESISPKHPDLYQSYKVTIYEDNFKKAMDPKIWPAGACVSRFFRIRKKINPET